MPGGTAACVLASRLSEDPSVTVLVLSRGRVQDSWLSRVPLFGLLREGHGFDRVNFDSEPVEECGGRQVRYFTSAALGGATRVNGLMLTRGAPGDYNAWAEMGLTDWGWERVEPYFRKLENALCHPGAKHRGHDGRDASTISSPH
jgi:choline dehydrogenase-like flavoprotein